MTPPISSYGADQYGLVYGYLFPRDGIGRAIDTQAASAWLADQGRPEKYFIWLHFNGAHTATQAWLRQHVDLPEEFAEALREGSRSTRIEQVQNGLIAVLNDVVYDMIPGASLQVATLWLVVGPHYLVSVRNQPLSSVDRLRTAVNGVETFNSPLALVIHLFSDQANVLVRIMRSASEKVDGIEDSFLAERIPKRSNLGQLRRDLVRLQRLLAPEPSALFRLLNHPPSWVGVGEAENLRQSTEEFSLVLQDIASLQERIKLLQEEVASHIGERTNRSLFVLTAVTVIALPINLTAGLFGMNVGGVPFGQDQAGFWIVVFLLMLVTGLAAWMVRRLREDEQPPNGL
ncbi:MAG: magnesium transporter CorA [Thiobacillus sp.]|nr:magnesium transporter CorA [Thiobacillus sp.]